MEQAVIIALVITIGVVVGMGAWIEGLMRERRSLLAQLSDARKYGDYWWTEYRAMRRLALAAAERLAPDPSLDNLSLNPASETE